MSPEACIRSGTSMLYELQWKSERIEGGGGGRGRGREERRGREWRRRRGGGMWMEEAIKFCRYKPYWGIIGLPHSETQHQPLIK